ncbi:hypothetical protein DERF_002033 [Dermatophagoides farinae]|uniref:Uncharacterized protein n=1 Tax=Dermatophagoides farinae TaxID=6954 RepID=A0A922IDJ0_DERFA|nr:hypothetical protein DERF_002033 [Dermatophagoides farinae]
MELPEKGYSPNIQGHYVNELCRYLFCMSHKKNDDLHLIRVIIDDHSEIIQELQIHLINMTFLYNDRTKTIVKSSQWMETFWFMRLDSEESIVIFVLGPGCLFCFLAESS